jgi:hypothetical protein
MEVLDVKYTIYTSLADMEWNRYLAVMWILCRELRDMYADELTADEDRLMVSTLDLVNDTILRGNAKASRARGAVLTKSWEQTTQSLEDSASPGRLNIWSTYTGLCRDVGRPRDPYAAAHWIGNAVEQWRRLPEADVVPKGAAREISDSSPVAKMMRRFMDAIKIVSDLPPDAEINLSQIRSAIFA